MISRRPALGIVLATSAILFAPGCATPPKMQLARQTPTTPGGTVWWVARDPANIRPPIVGIENRVDRTTTRQIVFCDRGVRVFAYIGGRLDRAGPPLPGPGAEADIALVRAALRHYQPAHEAADRESVASIRTVADVADLLDECCPAGRVEPTVGLTYYEIDAELEHCAHGASELIKASEAFQ